VALGDGHIPKTLGNIPVGQWFPNNIRGKIKIRQKNIYIPIPMIL
jgi:hypothetical protein